MREAGVSDRMDMESFIHEGTLIAHDGEKFRIDFKERTRTSVVVYGQTELTRDLYEAREAAGGKIIYIVDNVTIEGAETDSPSVRYEVNGTTKTISCDFRAGCDGFHCVSRQTIPLSIRKEYEKNYPFGWLGVLSETPPVSHELIYSNSPRGFGVSVQSLRSPRPRRQRFQWSAHRSV